VSLNFLETSTEQRDFSFKLGFPQVPGKHAKPVKSLRRNCTWEISAFTRGLERLLRWIQSVAGQIRAARRPGAAGTGGRTESNELLNETFDFTNTMPLRVTSDFNDNPVATVQSGASSRLTRNRPRWRPAFISRSTPMQTMCYIGLDVHKRTISYCGL
jgi:hypothetical protein